MIKRTVVELKKDSPLVRHFGAKTDKQQRLEDIRTELNDLTELFLKSSKRLADQIDEIQRMM